MRRHPAPKAANAHAVACRAVALLLCKPLRRAASSTREQDGLVAELRRRRADHRVLHLRAFVRRHQMDHPDHLGVHHLLEVFDFCRPQVDAHLFVRSQLQTEVEGRLPPDLAYQACEAAVRRGCPDQRLPQLKSSTLFAVAAKTRLVIAALLTNWLAGVAKRFMSIPRAPVLSKIDISEPAG